MTVGALLVAGLVLRLDADDRAAASRAGGSPAPSFAPASASPTSALPAAGLGPSFPPDAQLRPTGDAGQAKLWFHDGRWWGVLLAEGEFRIHAFDPVGGWTDTGTIVDGRSSSHADVLADGDELVVASAGRSRSAANAVEVRRFTYDGTGKLYRADRQFPIRISDTGASHVSLARSADATLWVTFVAEQRLEVVRTLGDARNWSEPATIAVPDAAEPIDAAAVASSGDQVAVLAATASGGSFVAVTSDGGTRWTSRTLLRGGQADVARVAVLRAGPVDGPRFLGITDVPAAPDGASNSLAAHLMLVSTDDGEAWSTHAVSRVEDGLVDPTLVVDEAARAAVVFAIADGAVRRKDASLDRLVVPSGRGQTVLPTDVGARFQEPASSRVVRAGEGIVVVAADSGSGRYGQAASDVPDVAGGLGRSTDGTVLAEAFEGRPAESGPPPGWQLASDVGSGELVLRPGIDGLGLQVRTAAGTTASLAVRYAGEGTGDAVLASLRGAGEAVSVRVDVRGRIAWFDGPTKQVGDRTLAPATWYRLDVNIDSSARTFGFVVRDAGGASVTETSGAAWRSDDAQLPDQLCISTREGPGAELTIDDVRVQRS
jgi:hypothetical protein